MRFPNRSSLASPYHDNAFVISRALHMVNMLNFSSNFRLLEWFFKHHVKIHKICTAPLDRRHGREAGFD
ncbi:hypothetical protein Patl1_36790 [Pistacia atlantica]|nr:hypothetical protein Patl1_36790 [Pistacia atlantica]